MNKTKTLILIASILINNIIAYGQDISVEWIKQAGGINFDAVTESTTTIIKGLNGEPGSTKTYFSTWHLTKIISVDKTDEINFSYVNGCYGFQRFNKSVSLRYLWHTEKYGTAQLSCGCSLNNWEIYNEIGETSKNHTNIKHLSEITTDNYSIRFITSNRDDYYNLYNECDYCQKLDSILVFGNNKLIKGFNFNYDSNIERLYLTEIKNLINERDEIEISIYNCEEDTMTTENVNVYIESAEPPFVFEYINIYGLPVRESTDQDHWGYYNNAGNYHHQVGMIPYHPEYEGQQYAGDRESSEACLNGMLSKRIYPTGGYTEFEFGTHKIPYNEYKNDYYAYSDIEEGNPNLYEHTDNIDIDDSPSNGASCNDDISCDFTTNPQNLDYNCNWMKSINFPTNNYFQNFSIDITVNTQNMKGGDDPYVKIYIYETDLGGGNDWPPTTKSTTLKAKKIFGPSDEIQEFTYDESNLNLQPDKKYYIIAEVCQADSVDIHLSYYNESGGGNTTDDNIIIGGARIEKITTNNGIDDTENVLIFDYTKTDNSEESSGRLFNFPKYEYSNTKSVIWNQSSQNQVFGYCYWSVMQHISLVPLGASSGSHVGYSRVKIMNGENAENGYTINTYKNDTTDLYRINFPFTPVSKDVERGKLLTSEIYNKNDDLVKRIENEYTDDKITHDENIENLKTYTAISGVVNNTQYENLCSDGQNAYGAQTYRHNTDWLYLNKTTETIFDDNKEFITVTEYEYNNSAHSQLSKIIKKDGYENELYTIENTYPKDLNNGNSAIDYMNDNHIVTPIIKKTKKVNNKVVAAIFNNYIFDNDYNFIYSDKIYRYTGNGDFNPVNINETGFNIDNNYEIAINFKKDEFGNIIEYYKENDIPTSIIWGYNNSLPVAKIENLAYNSSLINLSDDIQLKTDEEDLINALNILYTDYPNAFITIYTYNEKRTGISSITDINNKTTKYKYNNTEKLELVRDFENKILKYIEYHYKIND